MSMCSSTTWPGLASGPAAGVRRRVVELDGAPAGVGHVEVPRYRLDVRGRPLLPGLLYGSQGADPGGSRATGESGTRRRMLAGPSAGNRGPLLLELPGHAPHAPHGVPASTWLPPCPSATSTPGPVGHRGARRAGRGPVAAARGGADGGGIGTVPGTATALRRRVDRRLLRADRGRCRPPGRRVGHLRGHPHRVGGHRPVERGAGLISLPHTVPGLFPDRRAQQCRGLFVDWAGSVLRAPRGAGRPPWAPGRDNGPAIPTGTRLVALPGVGSAPRSTSGAAGQPARPGHLPGPRRPAPGGPRGQWIRHQRVVNRSATRCAGSWPPRWVALHP